MATEIMLRDTMDLIINTMDTDEEIDAFINGWELGIKWFKKQNNIK